MKTTGFLFKKEVRVFPKLFVCSLEGREKCNKLLFGLILVILKYYSSRIILLGQLHFNQALPFFYNIPESCSSGYLIRLVSYAGQTPCMMGRI